MKIPSVTCVILLIVASSLHAQKTSADFNLYLQSKPVGRAKVQLQQSAKGVKLNTRFAYKYLAPGVDGMKPATTSLDVSDEFLYSPTFAYMDGTSENMDTHFRNSFVPSKKRDEIVIQDNTGQSNAGSTFSDSFKIGPNLVLLVNFDPGAAQCALRSMLANPTPDHLYSVFLGARPRSGGGSGPTEGPPSGGRRGGGSGGRASQSHEDDDAKITVEAKFSPLPDGTGTLDGKVIPVKAYELVSPRITWFFFADTDGNLLEADVLPIHADSIRAGFQRTAQPLADKE